ncbi:LMCD1 protein, partial [Copsychus sechellarum]|nr:LMCD1 protein [Copsychus sechellarum]
EAFPAVPALFQMSGRGVPCLRCRGLCTGFEPHSWRKVCRACRCPQEEHGPGSELDDDRRVGRLLAGSRHAALTARPQGGDGARIYKRNRMIVTNPNVSGKDPTFHTVTYEWAPPGLTQKLAMQYMQLVPPELQPVAGTQGALQRRLRLARQLPLHDQDPAQCRGLAEGERPLMEEFVRSYKAEALGVGEVALPGQGGAREEQKPQDGSAEPGRAPESPNGALESTAGAGHDVSGDGVWDPGIVGSWIMGSWDHGIQLCVCLSVCLSVPQLIFSEDYQQVEGLAWHHKHFACGECETPLAGKPFTLANASLLCSSCSQSRA